MSSERVSDILFAMRRKGIKIWTENGQLRYKTAQQALTTEDLESLRALRQDILTFLEQPASLYRESRPVPWQLSDRVPLSFPQQYLWELAGLQNHPSMRQVAAAVRLEGRLDIGCLQQSLQRLVARHEALRTRIVVVEGVPEQHVDNADAFTLEILDLASSPDCDRESEARRLVAQIVHEPVFLATDPLFAARLIKLDGSCHVLVVATEHLIADAASIGIIWRDLFAGYSQAIRGQPYSLPEVAVQYPDYAIWQQSTHCSWVQSNQAYWAQRLAGARRLHVFAREDVTHPSGMRWATLPVRFGKTLSRELLEISRIGRTSLVMSVLTAFVALLSQWCNVADLVIQFVTRGRAYPEVNNTVGLFGVPLFVRIELAEEDTFLDLLGRVTREYTAACEHDHSCRTAVQMCGAEFGLNPLFNWIPQEFNMNGGSPDCQARSDDALVLAPFGFAVTPREGQEWDGEPRIDLSDSKEGVSGAIGYRADRVAPDTVERFGRSLLLFAQKLAREPGSRVRAVGCER